MEKQTAWINDLLDAAREDPTRSVGSLIECCGKGCAVQNGHLEGVKALSAGASACKTRSDRVAFLRANFPFKVSEADDGIVIHLGKEKCTCPMSPEVSGPMLCNCTLGHEKAFWSAVFGKEVDAEIVESFQRGGKDCVIKLML